MNAVQTIPALFTEQAKRYGQRPLFWVKQEGRYRPISWDHALQTVQALQAFLVHAGIKPGDRVLILSENRPEWGMADLAIQAAGAWTVPIYASLTEQEILHIARDCEPVAGFASSREQAKKLQGIREQVRSMRLLIIMDHVTPEPQGTLTWTTTLKQGREAQERLRDLMAQRLQQLTPEETATIIYTSGTTGEPKGVMLSHRNFLSNAASCLKAIHIRSTDLHLSFLPLSHVFERMAGWYLMVMVGASVAYAESMDTIPQNMLETHPTVMLGVPRFFEKLYARVQESLKEAPPSRQRIIQWALSVGQRASLFRLKHHTLPFGLWVQHALAARLVFRKFHQRLGGRLRFFVSGSAPLPKAIGEFFYSAGIVILEGYGLTETSPVISVNRFKAVKFGTVGLPLEEVEVRIAEDGEILTRGPHIMQGYYRKPEETQAVLTDGWFQTGDIGHLDEEGFLTITDRKKDLIKTAGGKFVAPQKLENLFVTDPYISQAFVYGERERYCVALIVPSFPRLTEYAREHGIPCRSPSELCRSPLIRDVVWQRIQHLQQQHLASFEQVKGIALLEQEFTQTSGELTPTLKAKRAIIAAHHHDVLHQLYQQPSS